MCPVQPPSKTRGASPLGWGKAQRRRESRPEHREQPDQTRRGAAARGHEARQRGTLPATTKAHGQVPSNNGHCVPQTRAARTTRNEPRHRNRCQATPNQYTTNPSQEWRGTSGARTQTHTPQHPSQEWPGAAESRAETHTAAQPHRTPQPEVAGYRRNTHTNTHTPQHPSQEWRGTAETRVQAHTPASHTPTRNGLVQAERADEHTHTGLLQPGSAGRSRYPTPRTHINAAHPSQEWRGTSRAGPGTHTHPNTPARSGWAHLKTESKHTHPHRTRQP